MTTQETAGTTTITPPLRPHETPPESSCWCGEPATYVIPGTSYFYCTRHADATNACYQRWSQIPEGRSNAAVVDPRRGVVSVFDGLGVSAPNAEAAVGKEKVGW